MRLAAIILILLFGRISFGSTLELTSEERNWLKSHPVIRISGPRSFPPFQFVNSEGSFQGMAMDYVQYIADKLGVTLEIYKDIPWHEVLVKIQSDELDLLTCASKTLDRQRFLSFSDPYLSFPLVIIARKDGDFLSSIEDLNGKRIALVDMISTKEYLRNDGIAFTHIPSMSPLSNLEMVSSGVADVTIANLATATYLIEKHGLANLKIAAPTPYKNEKLHIAVRKDWKPLTGILNKALAGIPQDEHVRIRNRWIAVRYEHGITSMDLVILVFSIVIISGAVIGGIFSGNRRLKKEIKERIDAQKALQKIVTEKEVLVKEIHHRVKNNLFTIQNLLMLQAYNTEDENSRILLEQTQDRINAMSLIHDRLYNTHDHRNISFSEYITQLSANLFTSHVKDYGKIRLELNVAENVEIDIDLIIPCGLIVNELVSNAIKHAFPEGREGMITVSLESSSKEVFLSVKDSGIGFPSTFDVDTAHSTGVKLITALVKQIHGKLEIITDKGSEFRVRFPQNFDN